MVVWLYSCMLFYMHSSSAKTTKQLQAVFTCDEDFTVFTDGKLVSPVNTKNTTNTTNKLSFYMFPPGIQVIAVKCVHHQGEAGILGSFDNGLVTDTRWKCSGFGERPRWRKALIMANYDDNSWPQAVAYDPNRAWTVLGRFSEISDNAYWIWSADKRTNGEVYCRRRVSDFSAVLQHSPKGMFQATLEDRDHALLLHSHSRYEVTDVTHCAQKCRAASNCLSFNFQHKSKSSGRQCELNTVTRGQEPTNYTERRDYTYYEDIGKGSL